MRDRDPQPLGGAVKRLMAILAARGIDPATAPANEDSPAHGGAAEALHAAGARIPPRYRDALADHPKITAWVHQVVRTAAPGPHGSSRITGASSLLIAGETGTGKTHQAYGAILALLAAGVRLHWQATTSADLYAATRPRNAPDHDPERLLRTLGRCPLLMLDDLGAAKATEWTEEITYRLLNARYNELLPTLITTNLPIRQLRDQLGDRVASRLAEMTDRVVLAGADRRRRPPAA